MTNTLWYQECRDGIWARNHLQKLINLYCFDLEQYKVPEDITFDNLQGFIEIILTHYQYYHLDRGQLLVLGDAFDSYIGNGFEDEFPDNYPEFPNTDRRQLVLEICSSVMQYASCWFLFPEDVPFILECLNSTDDQIILMYDKLDEYFEQFDDHNRYIEDIKRWEVITKQRMEALEKGEPLPIRPMGIKLDMCYKEPKLKN